MGLLAKIFNVFNKSTPNERIEKEAEQRGVQFLDNSSFKMNEGIKEAQDNSTKEVFTKSFFRPYSQDGEDAFTTPETDTFRIRDGLGQDIDVDSGRKLMNDDSRSAASRNGMEDVGEDRDDLADREDRQDFNLMGNGLRDASTGFGRESSSLGYPNPSDNQQGNSFGGGFDPNSNNGMGQ